MFKASELKKEKIGSVSWNIVGVIDSLKNIYPIPLDNR